MTGIQTQRLMTLQMEGRARICGGCINSAESHSARPIMAFSYEVSHVDRAIWPTSMIFRVGLENIVAEGSRLTSVSLQWLQALQANDRSFWTLRLQIWSDTAWKLLPRLVHVHVQGDALPACGTDACQIPLQHHDTLANA